MGVLTIELIFKVLSASSFLGLLSFLLFYSIKKKREKVDLKEAQEHLKQSALKTDKEFFDNTLSMSNSFSEVIEKLTIELSQLKIDQVEANAKIANIESMLQGEREKNRIYENTITDLKQQIDKLRFDLNQEKRLVSELKKSNEELIERLKRHENNHK